MGAGGSPRQCAINLKRGLPTAPILGGAEGGLSASYPSVGFLLSVSSYLHIVRQAPASEASRGPLLWPSFHLFYLSKVLTFGVSVLYIPLNWGFRVDYHIFTDFIVGTPTAVLLHRRERILIITPYLGFLAIPAFYSLGLLRGTTKHVPYHQCLQPQKG